MNGQAMPSASLPAAAEANPITANGSFRTGLIGWPVEHSVSPAMHNAAFEALGIPGCYALLPTAPQAVAAAVTDLKLKDYRGANVTIPHKQAVMPYLDELTDAAQAIGAVNTILVVGDRLLGHNTDAGGFLAALREAGCEPAGLRTLVLGAGGAARAVVYALVTIDCPISIYNRTEARAKALADDLQSVAEARGTRRFISPETNLSELDLGRFDLLVNTTSVGMWPETEDSPWPALLPLPAQWIVVDLVYNPQDTRLLADARAAGAISIGGLGMLVHQGALAFQLWTGHTPPLDIMYAAAKRALGSQAMSGADEGET